VAYRPAVLLVVFPARLECVTMPSGRQCPCLEVLGSTCTLDQAPTRRPGLPHIYVPAFFSTATPYLCL
jgi:hypothetical protein